MVQFCYLGQDEVTKILQDAVETKMKAVLYPVLSEGTMTIFAIARLGSDIVE